MKTFNVNRSVLSFCLIILLVMASCGLLFAAEQKPQYGGTLRVAELFEGNGVGYPPKMNKTLFAIRQVSPAVETLLRTNKAGIVVPWLASAVKEDPKLQTITLTLRKGVKFHDGTDFNAEAVKWNLEQHVAAKTSGTDAIKSIDVVDDSTVRISLTGWDSTFTGNLTQFLGMIISPAAYKKNGEEWAAKNPVGTGPFEFVSWQREVSMSYKKFPGYWQKGRPYLDKIEYNFVLDSQTRELSLRKGEQTMSTRLAVTSLTTLEKDGFVVTLIRGGSGAVSLIPDSANPNSPFAKVKVRQAVAHAIDNVTIVKNIYQGVTQPANQEIYKGNWAYNPAIAGYPYNPARAKQLLAEAGYPNGFKTKLLYVKTPEFDLIFGAVQGYLKAVGIDAELEGVIGAKHDQIARQGGKWEGLILGHASGNPDVVVIMSTQYAGGGKYLSQMIVPDDYLKAVHEAVSAPNQKSKTKAIQTAMKLMIDKYALAIPLFFMPDNVGANKKLHDHGMMATPNIGLWTPESAWMEK